MIFEADSEIINSRNCHIEKKVVKFNKKKHKKDPWITFAILKSVNKKNWLYKKLKKTNVNSENYEIRKQEFNMYKNKLRRLINQAKNSISRANLANKEATVGRHDKLLTMHYIENHIKVHLMVF